MTASDLFKAGKLQDAVAAQIQDVKAHPADPARRLFLFELVAFTGDLDRATRQIDAINYGQPELDAAVLEYRKLLDAERARRQLLSSSQMPKFFGPPTEHVGPRLEAVNRLRENRPNEVAELLHKANEALPPIPGLLNDKPVNSLRDCDDLFAGVLEVFFRGDYYWVPLDQVRGLAINPPKYPRDLIWTPARLELDDAEGEVYLPVLYPGTHEHADDAIRLGRTTDWRGGEGEAVLGVGARLFLVNNEDPLPVLEIRQFTGNVPAEE